MRPQLYQKVPCSYFSSVQRSCYVDARNRPRWSSDTQGGIKACLVQVWQVNFEEPSKDERFSKKIKPRESKITLRKLDSKNH